MSRTNENNMKGVVGISAPHSGLFTLEGRIYTTQPDNMQLYLYMDTNLYDNWSGKGEGISDEGYRVQVESYYTTFDNVYLDEDVLYTIMIELEDFEASDFVYNITLVDGNGERYGGESFQMPSDSTNITRVHARRVLEDNTASKGESTLSTCIPLEDIFSANSAFNIRQITIFDMAGKEVLRSFCNLSKTDMSKLAKGAYYVVVNTNEATYTCKIIK